MFTPGPPALTPVGTPDTLSETGSLKSGRSRRNAIPPNSNEKIFIYIFIFNLKILVILPKFVVFIEFKFDGIVSSVEHCPFFLPRSQPPYLHRNIGSGARVWSYYLNLGTHFLI